MALFLIIKFQKGSPPGPGSLHNLCILLLNFRRTEPFRSSTGLRLVSIDATGLGPERFTSRFA
jgi:hypothetical protein